MRKLSFTCFLVIAIVVFVSPHLCEALDRGYQGHAYAQFEDGDIGETISGVEISFIRESTGTITQVTTDNNGFYEISLGLGRYYVTATHPDYLDYDSGTGLWVVSELGYQTGNVFLGTLETDMLLVTTSYLTRVSTFDSTVQQYQSTLKSTEGLRASFIQLDSQACWDRYGVQVSNPSNWQEIRQVLGTLLQETQASYIMLLGGLAVVPRPVQNVPNLGGTIDVPSDAWYVDQNDDKIVDQGVSISRLPDLYCQSGAVVNALETAIAMHQAGGFSRQNPVGFSINPGDYQCPPYGVCQDCTMINEFFNLLSTSDYITFSGHGNETGFYNNEGAEIFTIDYIGSVDFQTYHPVIIGWFSCTTGGLFIDQPSMAYVFPNSGASLFLARSTIEGIPTYVADNFLPDILEGQRVGDVLFSLMRETVIIYGQTFTASAAHLCIYGDPTLTLQ